MIRLKVGEYLHPGVTSFEEGVHYNYSFGGHTLTIAAKDPSLSQISEIQEKQSTFALEILDDAVILLSKFGREPWLLSHYNWWINPPVMRPDPMSDLEKLNGGVLSINVCLVNASNGFVEALRTISLSHEFSFLLLKSVGLQLLARFDPCHYFDVIEYARKECRDINSVMADAICVCAGNFSFSGKVSESTSTAYH